MRSIPGFWQCPTVDCSFGLIFEPDCGTGANVLEGDEGCSSQGSRSKVPAKAKPSGSGFFRWIGYLIGLGELTTQSSRTSTAVIPPKSFECPSCKVKHCLVCSRIWTQSVRSHEGHGCNAWGYILDEEGKSNELWISHNTKRCPKCSANIQKRDGCNHMTCRCGFEFCWLCGAAYSRRLGYLSHEGLCRPPKDPTAFCTVM